MITLLLLAIIVTILVLTVGGMLGAGVLLFVVIFGDIILAVFFVVWLFKKLGSKNDKEE